jgi:hypothetical protein
MKLFCSVLWCIVAQLSFSQKRTDAFLVWPTTAYASEDNSEFSVFYLTHLTRDNAYADEAPNLVQLTFNGQGELLDSLDFTHVNDQFPGVRMFVRKAIPVSKDTAFVFGTTNLDQTQGDSIEIMYGQLWDGGSNMVYKKINDENGKLRYKGSLINYRGNLVLFLNDINYKSEGASYSLRWHFLEINPKTNELLQYKRINSDEAPFGTFNLLAVSENVIDSSIFMYSSSRSIDIISNQDFSHKQSLPAKYDKLVGNPLRKISSTKGTEYVTIAAWVGVDEGGTFLPGWYQRGDETMFYRFNEHHERTSFWGYRSEEVDLIHSPYAVNFDFIDTTHMWVAVGGYAQLKFGDLHSINTSSVINVWNSDFAGNVHCTKAFFEGENKNYTPWHVFATNDGGALIFATVYDFNISPTNWPDLYVLKVDDQCGLTKVYSQTLTGQDLVAYPNPSSTSIQFTTPTLQSFTAHVLDINGKEVWNGQYQGQAVSIASWAAGSYFFQGMSSDGLFVRSKFVKE